MPTILKIGSYRLFFYANDRDEPVHVHVEKEDMVAKFWLDPVRLQESGGFNRHEIMKLQKTVIEYQGKLLEAWNDYFHG